MRKWPFGVAAGADGDGDGEDEEGRPADVARKRGRRGCPAVRSEGSARSGEAAATSRHARNMVAIPLQCESCGWGEVSKK